MDPVYTFSNIWTALKNYSKLIIPCYIHCILNKLFLIILSQQMYEFILNIILYYGKTSCDDNAEFPAKYFIVIIICSKLYFRS